MAKFAVLFIAAIAFQAVVARSNEDWQRQQRQAQWMSQKIREASSDVSNAIENARTDSDEGKRAVMAQTNEFAYRIQKVVYYMQRAVQNLEGEDKKTYQQIAMKLSECAYTVQQAMNSEPNQMKAQLKTQVQNVADEAERLSQRLQQTQQPQQDKWDHTKEMKRAMMEILAILRKIKTRAENQDKNMQEVNTKMQEAVNEMTMYTQNLKKDDEQTAEDLADFVRQLAQCMNDMVDRLQRRTNNFEGEAKNVMKQVANKMSEKRIALEQTNTQGNTQQRVNEMKEQINATMRDAATQAQRLMQVAQRSNDQEGQRMKSVAKRVMTNVMACCKTMKTQMEMMTEQRN